MSAQAHAHVPACIERILEPCMRAQAHAHGDIFCWKGRATVAHEAELLTTKGFIKRLRQGLLKELIK